MPRACKKRKRSAKHKRINKGGVAEPQWLNLPNDILDEIFNLFVPKDALLSLPLVCKQWGRLFLEPIFCKQKNNCLDFMPLTEKPFYRHFYKSKDKDIRALRLMNLLVGVMHAFASDSQCDVNSYAVRATPITEIYFPHDLPLYDRHLVYVAERCPELRCIILPCAKHITGKGISRALRCWNHMEMMSYGPFDYQIPTDRHLPRTIEEIGVNCKNLQYLTLSGFHFHWQSADVMVRYLKSLKQLSLRAVHISKKGLQLFLSRCKELDGLVFYNCNFLTNGSTINQTQIKIWRNQDCRTKWSTDINSDVPCKAYTSKELVSLIWQQGK